jgi:hypothetical protein
MAGATRSMTFHFLPEGQRRKMEEARAQEQDGEKGEVGRFRRNQNNQNTPWTSASEGHKRSSKSRSVFPSTSQYSSITINTTAVNQ